MSDPIYFQWQNEHLLRTIYPLREMKLRDFLVYYYEIDLWAEYKDKTLEEIKPELEAFQKTQRSRWKDSFKQYTDLRAYFLEEDVTGRYRQQFPDLDQDIMDKINGIHKSFKKYFPAYREPRKERVFLTGRISHLEGLHQQVQKEIADKKRAVRNMGSGWVKTPVYQKDIDRLESTSVKMVGHELGRLYDFLRVFDQVRVRRDQAIKWFKNQEKDRTSKMNALQQKQWYVRRYPENPQYAREALELEGKIKHIEASLKQLKDLPEREQLDRLSADQTVALKDILRGKAELYREKLSQKNHQELLEEVVSRFLQDPARYPLWLQYMVIHFSGMRYKSAHGSWADPKDLLQSLRMNSVIEGIKRSPDETIEADLLDKITEYEKMLVDAEDQTRRDKIEYYLQGMKSSSPYRKRKALLDLRIDEEIELVDEQMTDEQVLEELEDLQDQLPAWMWKEIVARTDLRLNHATDKSWEELSPDEIEERRAHESQAYRQIMLEWKKKNLTGWRNEHDRTNRLIVTRAVCNEVSEHIQHLRGHTPPGGLTGKPEWYLRKEKDPDLLKGVRKPYLVKPDSQADFRVGSTILWLRWVDSKPNAWRIAHPLSLKNGEGLLPGGTIKRAAVKPQKSRANVKANALKQPTGWNYQSSGNAFQRNRTVYIEQEESSTQGKKAGKNRRARIQERGKKPVQRKKPRKVRKNQRQWLRWMHEATVAEVAETVDGPVVLTFETALPYEDRRRSTIGVFKHTVSELRYRVSGQRFNGTFVGYVPENKAEVPYSDLEQMLDWNKILRRQILSEAEMKAYWAKAKQWRAEPGAASPGDEGGQKVRRQPGIVADSPVEVAPVVLTVQHKEKIVCYQVDPTRNRAVVYQPKVELQRGVQLRVAKTLGVQIGKRTYYPVTRCDTEPRAQELYIRGDNVVDLPEGQLSRPVEARGKVNPRKITRANLKGRPIMELAGVKLPDKTPFRVSTVHRVTEADSGDGVIDADGSVDYYLIVDCPLKGNAKGLFIQTHAVNPITEEEYQSRFDLLQQDEQLPPELLVEVSPKAGGASASLFRAVKAGAGSGRTSRSPRKRKKSALNMVKSAEDTMPKGKQLTVSSTSVVSDEKEYYQILACAEKPAYVGMYILVKETKPAAETSISQKAAGSTAADTATRPGQPERGAQDRM